MQKLALLGGNRIYWLSLLILGFGLESAALYFQYVQEIPPCVMCIHVRLWVLGMITVAIAGALGHRFRCGCGFTHLLMAGVMAGLLDRAWQLLGTERGFIIADCGFDLGLPSWLAIQEWLPTLFEVQTTCGYTPVLAFGITTAEFLLAMSAGLLALSLVLAFAVLVYTPE